MEQNSSTRARLKTLEDRSVFILREAFSQIDKLAMLWSLGKDSNVMVWLARKAFFGHIPFLLVHVDTGKKFPEMYEFRDRYSVEWGANLITGDCPPVEEMDDDLPPAARSAARKTAGLNTLIETHGFQGVIAGIRRDEEGTRAKERIFSPRGIGNSWDVRNQPPEFWDQFRTKVPEGTHIRIHPLLHWSEIDIWRYIGLENIPMVDLYFSKDGKRYRSLGDQDITNSVESGAATVEEIIAEFEVTDVAERSGRAMDHEREDAFEALRTRGYM